MFTKMQKPKSKNALIRLHFNGYRTWKVGINRLEIGFKPILLGSLDQRLLQAGGGVEEAKMLLLSIFKIKSS